MDVIPDELLIKILSFVRCFDIVICNSINMKFRDITVQTIWSQGFFVNKKETLHTVTKKFKFIEMSFGNLEFIDDNDVTVLNTTTDLPFNFNCSMITDKSLINLSANIKILNIPMCSNITDNGVSYLTNLTCLDISHIQMLTNNAIKNLTGLKSLTMNNGHINGEGIEALTGLEKLYISGYYNISNKIMMSLTKLKILDIKTGGTIDYCFLEQLKLSEISISIENISEDDIKYLKDIPKVNVRKFNNQNNNILGKIQNLKSLTIRYGGHMIEEDVISTLTNLKMLELTGFITHDDACFQYLTKLKKLIIRNSSNYSEKCLSNLSNLKYLNTLKCSWITDITLSYLDKIHMLTISDSDKITNEGLRYLTNVKYISIQYCHQISDDGLKYLSNVTHLNITGCLNITTLGISYLINIQNLTISIDQNIDYDSFFKLKSLIFILVDNCFYIPIKSSIDDLKSKKSKLKIKN
jgi:hypothetical protein